MNCADDRQVPDYSKKEGDILTLVYTGNITRNRGEEIICKAIENLLGVELEKHLSRILA